MVDRVKFRFDFDKFCDVITAIATRVSNLDKLKAGKLLYLSDRLHLVKYGRPIIGDTYYRLPYGPIPSLSLDFINDLINPVDVRVPMPDLNKLKKRLRVVLGTRKYPVIEVKGEYELRYLSESENDVLNKTVEKYGSMSSGQLIDITHTHATWLETAENQEIDYRLFFKGNTDAQDGAFEYMMETQEDLEFVSSLND
jgi:uncharacterized phage-associated protein